MLPGIKLFDLTDRVAIVTGGSKGLGKAMADGLASAGAKTVLISRNQSEVDAAAAEITSDHQIESTGIKADVSNQGEIESVVKTVVDRYGRVDILINNAGINIRGPIDELSLDDFRKVQQINVDGIWIASRAVAPQMKQQGNGRIINLASTLGLVGLANRTPYATSKGAVVQFTRALALELRRTTSRSTRFVPARS